VLTSLEHTRKHSPPAFFSHYNDLPYAMPLLTYYNAHMATIRTTLCVCALSRVYVLYVLLLCVLHMVCAYCTQPLHIVCVLPNDLLYIVLYVVHVCVFVHTLYVVCIAFVIRIVLYIQCVYHYITSY